MTGNKTLARQLEGEARDLGAPTVRFEGRGDQFAPKDLRAYGRANAIGVMNYWVYINQNPAIEPAEYLVLDDAQLAEGRARFPLHRAHREVRPRSALR